MAGHAPNTLGVIDPAPCLSHRSGSAFIHGGHMAKLLLTGAARPVSNINERARALFKDRADYTPRPPPQRKRSFSKAGPGADADDSQRPSPADDQSGARGNEADDNET
jgi:hypothetical protein